MSKWAKRVNALLILLIIYFVVYIAIEAVFDLKVGFDYDDTFRYSTPAFEYAQKKYKFGTKKFWETVNNSYELERNKIVVQMIAYGAKALGFDIIIISARKRYGSDNLIKYWGNFIDEFHFEKNKSKILKTGYYVAFFGDSDSDITEAKKAGVFPIRVQRSERSSYKAKYHPGRYNEFILPLSKE